MTTFGCSTSGVTRNWIIYNKGLCRKGATPELVVQNQNAHAGSLLAFGLMGSLAATLTASDLVEYISNHHDPTTIALFIGLPASKMGSADPLLSKTLCLHLPSLNKLDASSSSDTSLVQIAA